MYEGVTGVAVTRFLLLCDVRRREETGSEDKRRRVKLHSQAEQQPAEQAEKHADVTGPGQQQRAEARWRRACCCSEGDDDERLDVTGVRSQVTDRNV